MFGYLSLFQNGHQIPLSQRLFTWPARFHKLKTEVPLAVQGKDIRVARQEAGILHYDGPRGLFAPEIVGKEASWDTSTGLLYTGWL